MSISYPWLWLLYLITCCHPTTESAAEFHYFITILRKDTCSILASVSATAVKGNRLILWEILEGNFSIVILKDINIEVGAWDMAFCILCRSTDI